MLFVRLHRSHPPLLSSKVYIHFDMPREIKDLKEFLSVCSRKDARHVKVKTNVKAGSKSKLTKFKVRCSKFLYTFVVPDSKKAFKIRKSISPKLKQVDVTARKHGKK